MEQIDIKETSSILIDKVESWITTAVAMLPNFVIAVLVVLAFWLLARLVKRLTGSITSRLHVSPSLANIIKGVAYIAVIAIGIFTALSVLNLEKAVTSLLAGVGIVGLALGFAFQDIAANFVAGVLISLRKPYRVNDLIEAEGHMGIVQEINLRSTIIKDFQGQEVIIPNKEIFSDPIKNYSRYSKRRIDLSVGVSYGDDLDKVKDVAVNAIKGMNGLDTEKGVSFVYTSFGDSSINFDIRFWVPNSDQPEFLNARSNGIIAIKKAFDEHDIMIPFPIRTLDFGIRGGEKLETIVRQMNGQDKSVSKAD